MWKSLTRGIRETLERHVCRTNVYSQSSQTDHPPSQVKKPNTICKYNILPPIITAYKHGFFGSVKTGRAKDEYNDSRWKAKHTWTEAVGWSSILAVGWVVCQSLCLQKKIFNSDQKDVELRTSLSQLSHAHLKCLLAPILNLKPTRVLPVTNCVGKFESNEKSLDQQWKTYGPITAEEALEEASNEFMETHKYIMGEFELRHGVKAIEENRHQDAVKHFSVGAKFSSPGSMFNLGLCYEQGMGTLMDLRKAAKYYKRAAERGHADAMYNLGVFHAQGKGGLPIDVDVARDLFSKAAKLGQTEALRALDLERIVSKIDSKLGNNYDKDVMINSESFHRLEELKNSTDIFLEILGITKSNHIPVSTGTNNMSY